MTLVLPKKDQTYTKEKAEFHEGVKVFTQLCCESSSTPTRDILIQTKMRMKQSFVKRMDAVHHLMAQKTTL